MGATIKDVARETHLSISTISKYMNGGVVRKKNKVLIDEAVRRLNYSPNSVARGLRTAKTYRVGLLAGAVNSAHTAGIINEIERKLSSEGYALTYMDHEYDANRTGEYVQYMVRNGVDGIIITGFGGERGGFACARDKGIPVVAVEERAPDIEMDCVQVDCAGGAYEIVEHLVKAGHTKIGVIGGPEKRATARERLRGYLRVMEDYEIPVCSEYIITGSFAYGAGYEGIERLWRLKERPTAVFIANYELCVGAMAAVYDLGIKVPEELSVVSFDDFEFSLMVNPRLTTVCQPLGNLADTACELLCTRIGGDYSDFPKRVRLKPRCICRDSVASPRKFYG